MIQTLAAFDVKKAPGFNTIINGIFKMKEIRSTTFVGKKKMKECTGQAHKKGAPSKRKGSNYVTEWL